MSTSSFAMAATSADGSTYICQQCGCVVPREHVLLENEHCWFLRKPQPVLVGSGIVMPKAHRDTVFDLHPDEWAATREILVAAKEWLDAELAPQGYNIGWNCGVVGGQQTFHAHMHVIPRFRDEPFAGKGIRWWFNSSENLRSSLRDKGS